MCIFRCLLLSWRLCPTLCDLIDCFPGGSVVKNSPANAGDSGDLGWIPGSGRIPGSRNRNPLQYFHLGNQWTEEPGGLQSYCACAQSCLTLCDHIHCGLPFPSPGDLPDSGIETVSPVSPAQTGRFFSTSATWEAWKGLPERKLPFRATWMVTMALKCGVVSFYGLSSFLG